MEHTPSDKQKYLEVESHYPIIACRADAIPLPHVNWPLPSEMRIYVHPGMDPGDQLEFDILTIADPRRHKNPLTISLQAAGVKWKKGLPPSEAPWSYLAPFVVLGFVLGLFVSAGLCILTKIEPPPEVTSALDAFRFVFFLLVGVVPTFVIVGLFLWLGELLWVKLVRR